MAIQGHSMLSRSAWPSAQYVDVTSVMLTDEVDNEVSGRVGWVTGQPGHVRVH